MSRGIWAILLFVAPLAAAACSTGAVTEASDDGGIGTVPAEAEVHSETISALSCSQSAVQNAINSANDGDIVVVPAGNCTWTTTVAKTPSVDVNNKKITIQGAGIDQTIITDSTGIGWKESPFWVSGKPARITGFTFQGTSDNNGIIKIIGTFSGFRVDHCKFNDVNGIGISVKQAYGLIDNCTFMVTRKSTIASIVLIGRDGESWSTPNSFGTAEALYIEDSTFNYSYLNDSAIQAGKGARYVFRHNTVINTQIDAHGSCTGGGHSTFSVEVYENTFTASKSAYPWGMPRAVHVRGGTGVFFNNSFTNYKEAIDLNEYRVCQEVSHNICKPPWDSRCTTYPCEDGIGRGTNQSSEPLYEWGNTLDGVDVNFNVYDGWSGCVDPSMTDIIQENRDYYNNTQRPGYTPYAYPHPLTIGLKR